MLASTAGDGVEENQRENSPGGAEGGDWSISSESHPFALRALVAEGTGDEPGLDMPGFAFIHANLVFSSTGQASIAGEVCSGPCVDILILW